MAWAFPQQQAAVNMYQSPSGFVSPVTWEYFPASPTPAAPGDKFAHLRGIPMFRLSVASDIPTHTHIVTKTAYKITKHMKMHRSVLTRWSTPAGAATTCIVDVYQIRNPFSAGLSPFQVHVSRDAQIRLGGKFDVNARRGKVWTKRFTRHPIEEVVLLVNGMVIPLEVVERKEERVAPEESEEVKERFRSWSIPA